MGYLYCIGKSVVIGHLHNLRHFDGWHTHGLALIVSHQISGYTFFGSSSANKRLRLLHSVY